MERARYIRVFVGQETLSVGPEGVEGHPCLAHMVKGALELMPEEDRRALEIASKLAEEYSLELDVVNVKSLRGRLRAWRSGVKRLPAIAIGDEVFDGSLDEAELRRALERWQRT